MIDVTPIYEYILSRIETLKQERSSLSSSAAIQVWDYLIFELQEIIDRIDNGS